MKKYEKEQNYKAELRTIIFLLLIIGGLLIVNQMVEKGNVKELSKDTAQAASSSSFGKEKTKHIESKITDWNLILVNKEKKIPENYKVELKEIENGYKVDARIEDNLKKMLADARKEGLEPWICSSYRTSKTQEGLYNKKVNAYISQGYSRKSAEENAHFWVALPRTSEHELGLALDIVDKNYQLLDDEQSNTPLQQWLIKNCYNYGFILRYTEDKQEYTKTNAEPWHYRYVGVENALFMKQKNFCLEEYINYLEKEQNG